VIGLLAIALSLACTANPVVIVTPRANTGNSGGGVSSSGGSNSNNSVSAPRGETGRVTNVIDGDTIDVNINGEVVRIRYLGMNTTERGETCYTEGRDANAALVNGQTVTLVRDREAEDRYGRALRYVYVGNTFVNAELVRQGWAEAVMYEPNDAHWRELIAIEQEAAAAGRGCHSLSTLFDDGTYNR
jgi:endonuclease YncB( thermonuclease family)